MLRRKQKVTRFLMETTLYTCHFATIYLQVFCPALDQRQSPSRKHLNDMAQLGAMVELKSDKIRVNSPIRGRDLYIPSCQQYSVGEVWGGEICQEKSVQGADSGHLKSNSCYVMTPLFFTVEILYPTLPTTTTTPFCLILLLFPVSLALALPPLGSLL